MIILPRPTPPTIISVGPVCGSSIAPAVDAGATTTGGFGFVTVDAVWTDAVLAVAGAAAWLITTFAVAVAEELLLFVLLFTAVVGAGLGEYVGAGV